MDPTRPCIGDIKSCSTVPRWRPLSSLDRPLGLSGTRYSHTDMMLVISASPSLSVFFSRLPLLPLSLHLIILKSIPTIHPCLQPESMAPSLLALPAELKIHIFSFVDLTDAEFAPLRFLCRTLLPMTTAERFRTFDIDTSEKSRERLHELMHKRCMVSGTSFHEWVKVLQIHEGVLEPARQDREEGGPDVAAADATEVPASLDKALDSSSTTNREHEEIEHAETPVLAGDRASNPNNENDEVKTQLMLASIDLGKVKEGEAPVIDHIAVQEKPEIGSNTAKDSPGRQETVVEETLQDSDNSQDQFVVAVDIRQH